MLELNIISCNKILPVAMACYFMILVFELKKIMIDGFNTLDRSCMTLEIKMRIIVTKVKVNLKDVG